jgi:hypothetical protein
LLIFPQNQIHTRRRNENIGSKTTRRYYMYTMCAAVEMENR